MCVLIFLYVNESNPKTMSVTKIAREQSNGLPGCDEFMLLLESETLLKSSTQEKYDFIVREAASRSIDDPRWDRVAAAILLHFVYLTAAETPIDVIQRCGPERFDKRYVNFVSSHALELSELLIPERDVLIDSHGLSVLMNSYLLKTNNIIETPQLFFLREAITVSETLKDVAENYDMLSKKYFTHATPTLFNGGLEKQQLSSCYVIHPETSTEGFLKAQYQAGLISSCSGGIGMSFHAFERRGKAVPFLKPLETTMNLAEQSGGKRHGRACVYVEPCNPCIEEILDLHKTDGKEDERCHDLYVGIWIPDIYMQRVESDGDWSLIMDTSIIDELQEMYGEAYEKRYIELENDATVKKRVVKARDLMYKICVAQAQSGRPFVCFKDSANRKSNHSHLGTIKSSNLCTEIYQYTDKDHTAVCNLASICLGEMVTKSHVDYERIEAVTRRIVRNLDIVIDRNYYPTEESKRANMYSRPIGIGVQGLQDIFFKLRLSFTSNEARRINSEIFRCIYEAAVSESCKLSAEKGPCPAHAGSNAAKGLLQPMLWDPSIRMDDLVAQVKKHGMRNSLLTALMPTATTSIIMGSIAESIEPIHAHVYVRRLITGELPVVNPYLVRELQQRDLWDEEMRKRIIAENGIISGISEIPPDIKELFQTVWDIKLSPLLELTADRAKYIDQGQSTNVHIKQPDVKTLVSYHMKAWRMGLKTGMYYLRQLPSQTALQFAVNGAQTSATPLEPSGATGDGPACSRDPESGCIMCSS